MLVVDTAFSLLELGIGMGVVSIAMMADAFHMVRRIITPCVRECTVLAASRLNEIISHHWLSGCEDCPDTTV